MSEENKKLFIDFGSTFTKAVYIDLARKKIIAKAKHFSTVSSDVTIGLKACFNSISEELVIENLKVSDALAYSSAAGGLRIACIGFVPDYSMEAVNLAALSAGAKVVGYFSYEITNKDIQDIEDVHPDIILLTGGTDGGDKKGIVHNANMLASREWKHTTILVAGNKSAVGTAKHLVDASKLAERMIVELGLQREK